MSQHCPLGHAHARRPSSLPELVHGEHGMRRPADVRLRHTEQAGYAAWSRRTLGICVIVVASVIAYPMIQRALSGEADAYAAERPREPSCSRWDEAASDALVGLVRGKQDADLRLVGDAVFRMRRARRNCHMGWLRLACLDYYAVIHGHAGRADTWPPASSLCAPANGEANRNAVTRLEDPEP